MHIKTGSRIVSYRIVYVCCSPLYSCNTPVHGSSSLAVCCCCCWEQPAKLAAGQRQHRRRRRRRREVFNHEVTGRQPGGDGPSWRDWQLLAAEGRDGEMARAGDGRFSVVSAFQKAGDCRRRRINANSELLVWSSSFGDWRDASSSRRRKWRWRDGTGRRWRGLSQVTVSVVSGV